METIRNHSLQFIPVLVIAITLTLTQADAQANPIQFDDHVDAGSYTLVKKGTGVLKYLRFIEAYAGALYTLPGLDPQAILTDTPKRLEVEYFMP